MNQKKKHTLLSLYCDKFIEAGWLAAIVLSALYMNIYTHRMFEPDKSCLLRSIAIFMVLAWIIKTIELRRITPQTDLEVTNQISWKPIWIPMLLLIVSYIISVSLSRIPFHVSFWGSYDRLQGVYTVFTYFIIFILAASHLRTKEQIERLVTTIILTSIPIIIYALIQRLGYDPVPWKGSDPTVRVSATMGNPIFLAAYLIMLVPLTLSRFLITIKKIITPDDNTPPLIHGFKIVGYGLLLAFQLISIILAKSRGPIAGCLAGGFTFVLLWFFITALRAKIFKPLIISGLIIFFTIVFIILLNVPGGPLESLRKIPYLERVANLNDFKTGSGRVRMIIWEGVVDLMKDASPSQTAFGYGPESLGTIFYKYHPPELSRIEGKTQHADRSHNSFLDAWITRGIFGLFTYMFLIATFFYIGIKALWKNWDNSTYRFLLLGLLAGISAHVLETTVGIDIVVTQTYFWLYLAGVWGIVRITETESSPQSESESAQKRGNKKKNKKNRQDFMTKTNASIDLKFSRAIANGIFWFYVGITFIICYAIMNWYWPDVTYSVDTLDQLIAGSYIYLLAALPIGAFAIIRARATIHPEKTTVLFSNFLIYVILLTGAVILFWETNIKQIQADGAYKFCFSYDTEAMAIQRRRPLQQLTSKEKQIIFNIRIASIPYYQRAIKLAPKEKTYLNGAGRNFMELARITPSSVEGKSIKDQFKKLPGLDEILNWDEKTVFSTHDKRTRHFNVRLSPRDFIRCCYVCLERGYQLEPANYERIISLAKIYHYWGHLERSTGNPQIALSKFESALTLYQEARKVNPRNEDVKKQNRIVRGIIKQLKNNPPKKK